MGSGMASTTSFDDRPQQLCAGAAVTGAITFTPEADALEQEQKKIKVVILGTGWGATSFLNALKPKKSACAPLHHSSCMKHCTILSVYMSLLLRSSHCQQWLCLFGWLTVSAPVQMRSMMSRLSPHGTIFCSGKALLSISDLSLHFSCSPIFCLFKFAKKPCHCF